MDVSCPQCNTLFELDAGEIGTSEVTLKCSQCGHLFRLELETGVRDESRRRWMVRKESNGDILYFSGFDTLHKWLMAGEIEKHDRVSRTGESWTRLQNIGEFAPIFQVVASIADLTQKSDGAAASASSATTPQKSLESRGGTEKKHRPAPSTGSGPASAPSPIATRPANNGAQDTNRSSKGRRRTSDTEAVSNRQGQQNPGRAGRKTVPGRPGQHRDGTTGNLRSVDGQSKASSEQSHSSKSGVQLEKGRFSDDEQPEQTSSTSGVAGHDEEWTLGELEHGVDTSADDFESHKRRRWPWIGALLAVAVVSIGVWQFDAIQTMAQDFDMTQTADEPVVVDTPEDSVASSIKKLEESIEDSVDAASSHQELVIIGESVGQAQLAVVTAHQRGREESTEAGGRRAQPTAADMIAGGRRALDRGNASQARERFEYALSLSPDNAEAYVGLGWAHLSDGNVDRSVEYFGRARDQNSEMGEALIGIGRAERNRQNYEAALSAYEQYLDAFPGGDHASIAEYQSQQLREQVQ